MHPSGSAVSHIKCRDCGQTYDLGVTEFPCRECGGILDPQYDYTEIDVARAEVEARSGSIWNYRELLPIRDPDNIQSLGEGETPVVACPAVAEEWGVGRVTVKDEGQNPTNTFKDRGATASISAAVEQGIDTVALPSAGNAGQAAAAYAAHAGLDCHVVLNYQSNDLQKTQVKAHGAELHLVSGQLDDAGAWFNEVRDDRGWYSVATFQTPFRHEGKKTLGYEIFEQHDWGAPDHIVYPTGGGVGLIGIWKAYQDLQTLGWLETEEPPALHVAQVEGCAPVVAAIEAGADEHEPVTDPRSVGRGIEVPDPGASPWILEAVDATGGTGVTVTDAEALAGCLDAAQATGVELCVEPGAAFAGARRLAEAGVIGAEESVLVVNTGAGNKARAAMEYALHNRD